MTNAELYRIAMQQSAYEANCSPDDFTRTEHVITISKEHPLVRKYMKLPHVCNLISYGSNIVATVAEEYRDIVQHYITHYSTAHCFETPNLHVLNDAFQKDGYRICFMAEYFLPDLESLRALPCDYELRILNPADFEFFAHYSRERTYACFVNVTYSEFGRIKFIACSH